VLYLDLCNPQTCLQDGGGRAKGFDEYLGRTCVRNVCTNTVSEPGDMLCLMTGHFIGTAAGTPDINTYVNN